jgi:predicted nucleic acid-binding protein
VRLGLRREATIVLSPEIARSARFHVQQRFPDALGRLEIYLAMLRYELVTNPDEERIIRNADLCRDLSDVSIALAAIDGKVDYLVTNDRDLTVVDSTTMRLRELVNVITPLALLRHILRWPESRIEAAMHRNWRDLPPGERAELGLS